MYGRDESEWDDLVTEGTRFLEERIRLGGTTSYTEMNATLARRTGRAAFDFSKDVDRAAMGELLGRIVQRDFSTRGHMLSALVIYLDGNDAGTGFYRLARGMGLLGPTDDPLAFWTKQLAGLGLR